MTGPLFPSCNKTLGPVSLLTLTPEIRVEILRLVLLKPTDAPASTFNPFHQREDRTRLLRTCKHLNWEGSQVLYGENKYCFDAYFVYLEDRCSLVGPSICTALRDLTIRAGHADHTFLQTLNRCLPTLTHLTILPRQWADAEIIAMLAQILHEPFDGVDASPTVVVELGLTYTHEICPPDLYRDLQRRLRKAKAHRCRPPATKEVLIRAKIRVSDWHEHWEQFQACGWAFKPRQEEVMPELEDVQLRPRSTPIHRVQYAWNRIPDVVPDDLDVNI